MRPSPDEVPYAQIAFGGNRSSKGRTGIVLNGTAGMSMKMVCKPFPALDNDSAFRAGSQITWACSGRGPLRLAWLQEQEVLASVDPLLLPNAGHAAEAQCYLVAFLAMKER